MRVGAVFAFAAYPYGSSVTLPRCTSPLGSNISVIYTPAGRPESSMLDWLYSYRSSRAVRSNALIRSGATPQNVVDTLSRPLVGLGHY
ncbi:hypothetical protein BH23BAC4_BH23BAC4_00650 [soil metagenome]